MRKHLLLAIVALLSCIALGSCVSSKSVVSRSADLSRYAYVSVLEDDTYQMPAELLEYQIMLYDAVEASGLKLINAHRIYDLTQAERDKLLMARYSLTPGQGKAEPEITITFTDYLTGRPLATCRARYTLGLTHQADLKGALKTVAKEVYNTFHKQKR